MHALVAQSPKQRIVIREAEDMAMSLSDSEISRAAEDGWAEVISGLCTSSPRAVLRQEEDMVIYASGFPNGLLNGVVDVRFDSETMEARTEYALSFFRERGLPMTFFLGPSSTPPELGDFLVRQGLVPSWTRPGMAICTGDVARTPLPKGLEIHRVDDSESLDACARTFAQGFVVDKELIDAVYDHVMGYGYGRGREWFVGILSGRPVSTSLLVYHKNVAGIYCVATLPEARGRGIGTALTREPLLQARETGFDCAILQSSKMGLPIYTRLGFREYCQIRSYVWSPER